MYQNLREAYKTQEGQLNYLRESIKDEYLYGENEIDRQICKESRLLVSLHGEEGALKVARNMWNPGAMKKHRQGYMEAWKSGKLTEALAATAFPAQLRLG